MIVLSLILAVINNERQKKLLTSSRLKKVQRKRSREDRVTQKESKHRKTRSYCTKTD